MSQTGAAGPNSLVLYGNTDSCKQFNVIALFSLQERFPEVQNVNSHKPKLNPDVKNLPQAYSVTDVLIPQGPFWQG